MSPEFRPPEPLSPREREVIQAVRKYEVPFLRKGWERWSEQTFPDGRKRGWLLCGPMTVGITRAVNYEIGIPILSNADPFTVEHIRFSPELLHYNEKEAQAPVDHVLASYFDGKGSVLHIDPVYDLLWGVKRDLKPTDNLRNAMHIAKYRVEEYDEILRNVYHLSSFVAANEFAIYKLYVLHRHYHDNRITHSTMYVGPSGEELSIVDKYQRYGPPLGEFIREVIPGWTAIR